MHQRREPTEARLLILEAAAAILREQGVAGVTVRAVAAQVGMTDAGVSHHFGDRAGLLTELLRHGGRQLRAGLKDLAERWLSDGVDPAELVSSMHEFYARGYGHLGAALHAAGWRDRGSGLLSPVVDALHQLRPPGSSKQETRLVVAALHQAMAMDSVYGAAFRRSAGILGEAAADAQGMVEWWSNQLKRTLDLDDLES